MAATIVYETLPDKVYELLMPDHSLACWEMSIWLNMPNRADSICNACRALRKFNLVEMTPRKGNQVVKWAKTPDRRT